MLGACLAFGALIIPKSTTENYHQINKYAADISLHQHEKSTTIHCPLKGSTQPESQNHTY